MVRFFFFKIGTLIAAGTIVGAASVLFVSFSFAQIAGDRHEGDIRLLLEQHCVRSADDCAGQSAEVETYRAITSPLRAGDILVIHVMLQNPHGRTVNGARVQLSYDPNVLYGERITLNEVLFVRDPSGTVEFTQQHGLARIDALSEGGDDSEMRIASLAFRVNRIVPHGAAITFHSGVRGEQTFVLITKDDGAPERILTEQPFVLTLAFADAPPPPVRRSTPPAEPPAVSPAFARLRVPHVVATIRGDAVRVSWRHPDYADLKGYEIVYGTGSGLHMHSLLTGAHNTSYTFWGLDKGSTYHFAVRPVHKFGAKGILSAETFTTVGRQEYIPAES